MSMIDPEKLAKRLLKIADRYAIERSQTKSVARTIAKAKQEAIAEAIEAVTQEIVEGESENPWRYFHEPWNNAVVRVRRNATAWRYHCGGDDYEIDEPDQMRLDFWDSWVRISVATISEITEAEAVAILGGKPWSDSV